MPRDPRYDILFEPVKIGPKTARNRFYQVPHCNGMGHVMPRAEAAMRGVKAEGGWAVVSTEECEIHPTSDILPFPEGRLWDDRDLPGLALMAEAVHRHGALAAIELTHHGPTTANYYSREAPIGPAHQPISWDAPVQARAMDKADIRDYRRWHRDAALRAKKAGFDIVYCYAGHDIALPMHFLQKRRNQRTDEYGGSLENRVRLLREIIEDTKEAVGDSCARRRAPRRRRALGRGRHHQRQRGPRRRRHAGRAAGPLGRQRQRLAQRLRHLALRRRGLSGTLHRLREEADHQARGRRRPLHLARRHGVADPARHPRHDRRRAAVDRRSVPAEEDRGGPARRHPRMHRLQHLRQRRLHHDAHPLHPEPDHGRGVAARLASRDHRRQGLRRLRARRRRRPGRARMRACPRPARLRRASRRGQRGTRRPRHPRDRSCRASRPGRACAIIACCSSTRWPMSTSTAPAAWRPADVREMGAAHVVVATGAAWRRDGVGRAHSAAVPGFDRAGVYTPDDIMAGRGDRRDRWSSSTTTTTTWAASWPRSCAGAGSRSRW